MAWKTEYYPSIGIVEVIYTGHVNDSELMEAGVKRIFLQKETGSKSILVDTSGITKLAAGTFDLYNLPAELYPDKEASRQSRMAVFLSGSEPSREIGQFFETVCYNRGRNVKVFEDRRQAMDWLLNKSFQQT